MAFTIFKLAVRGSWLALLWGVEYLERRWKEQHQHFRNVNDGYEIEMMENDHDSGSDEDSSLIPDNSTVSGSAPQNLNVARKINQIILTQLLSSTIKIIKECVRCTVVAQIVVISFTAL